MTATLALGSNLSDREAALREAVERLSLALGPCLEESPVLETQALGFDGQPFLNKVVRFDSDLEPLELLALCKDVEASMGRDLSLPQFGSDGSRIYHDRIIDIDILYYGSVRMQTPQLTIPHPQVHSRPYVAELLKYLLNLQP